MNREYLAARAIEFLCVAGISIILAFPKVFNPWWLALPIVAFFATYAYEYTIESGSYTRVQAVLGVLVRTEELRGVPNLRCTYYVHLWPRRLYKTFDYIPGFGGKGSGKRTFRDHKGIIGKAYQTAGPQVVNFHSDEEFRRRMVQEFNFTPEEVARRTADRRSYFCYPLVDQDQRVRGLIYLDSSMPDIFKDLPDPLVQHLIDDWCTPIASEVCS